MVQPCEGVLFRNAQGNEMQISVQDENFLLGAVIREEDLKWEYCQKLSCKWVIGMKILSEVALTQP